MNARRSAILLALASVAVYASVPVLHRSTDTDPQLFTAESWIVQGDAALDEYPTGLSNEVTVRGHAYSSYPLGLAVVSAPALAPFLLAGGQITDLGFRTLFGRLLAVLLSAASVAFVYLACGRIARPASALIAACVYAFGTSTYAITSQELTQHAPAQLGTAIGLFLLARGGPRAARAGAAFGFTTLARPLGVVIAAAGALSVLRLAGVAGLVRYIGWGLPAVAFLAAYNVIAFGSPNGVLYGDPIPWVFPPPGLAGLLVSPSRGLFVYSPLLLLAIVGSWQAWRAPASPAALLVRELSLAAVASWIAYSTVAWWWGGWSYGNRYLLDIVPILALAIAYAVDHGALAGRVRAGLAIAAAAWAVLLQLAGALYGYTYWNGYNWNVTPSIDADAGRLWSWTDPQWWSVVRQLFTDPGIVLVPALCGLAVGAVILSRLVARTRTGYSTRAESGGA